MKCIKSSNGAIINKVPDDEAKALLKCGWVYCPKSEWKNIHGKTNIAKESKVTEGSSGSSTESSMTPISGKQGKGGGKFKKEILNDRKRNNRMEELGTNPTKPIKPTKPTKPINPTKPIKPISKYAEKVGK